MTVREPSLSFGPWAKANSHLTSHTYSINYFREFYTKGVSTFFRKGQTQGVSILLLFVTVLFSKNEWTDFIKNGDAKIWGAIWRFP